MCFKHVQNQKNTCSVCRKELPLLAFSLGMQKQIIWYRKTKNARCLECQYPRCSSCHVQAMTKPNSKRAPKSKDALDKYICLTCFYPNCSECGQSMPEWRKRPSKNNKMQKRGESYLCSQCVQNIKSTCSVGRNELPWSFQLSHAKPDNMRQSYDHTQLRLGRRSS